MFKSIRKIITSILVGSFIGSSIQAPACAQVDPMPFMPKPGVMVHLSPEFSPAYLKGIVIHPEDPFKFDFIIYKGDKPLTLAQKKEEYTKLTKYFLASLAIPDDDQWVNLSPYEKDRIIKDDFGKTEMGRDLLAQDYMLKQITASLIYPEDNLGREFWAKVYAQAQKQYGTTNIPVNTFNKVWILPDDALIYEHDNTAYVLRNHLRVMLDEDYLSLQKHSGIKSVPVNKTHSIASQIVREIVLPELQREVNEDKNFAPLRQVYSGMLLATWFKHTLKQSVLGQIYANKAKVKGVDQDPGTNEMIYQQYLRAYKKGVFNFIKEDVDTLSGQPIPRKYFSGGAVEIKWGKVRRVNALTRNQQNTVNVEFTKDDDAMISLNAEKPEASAAMRGEANKSTYHTPYETVYGISESTGQKQKPQAVMRYIKAIMTKDNLNLLEEEGVQGLYIDMFLAHQERSVSEILEMASKLAQFYPDLEGRFQPLIDAARKNQMLPPSPELKQELQRRSQLMHRQALIYGILKDELTGISGLERGLHYMEITNSHQDEELRGLALAQVDRWGKLSGFTPKEKKAIEQTMRIVRIPSKRLKEQRAEAFMYLNRVLLSVNTASDWPERRDGIIARNVFGIKVGKNDFKDDKEYGRFTELRGLPGIPRLKLGSATALRLSSSIHTLEDIRNLSLSQKMKIIRELAISLAPSNIDDLFQSLITARLSEKNTSFVPMNSPSLIKKERRVGFIFIRPVDGRTKLVRSITSEVGHFMHDFLLPEPVFHNGRVSESWKKRNAVSIDPGAEEVFDALSQAFEFNEAVEPGVASQNELVAALDKLTMKRLASIIEASHHDQQEVDFISFLLSHPALKKGEFDPKLGLVENAAHNTHLVLPVLLKNNLVEAELIMTQDRQFIVHAVGRVLARRLTKITNSVPVALRMLIDITRQNPKALGDYRTLEKTFRKRFEDKPYVARIRKEVKSISRAMLVDLPTRTHAAMTAENRRLSRRNFLGFAAAALALTTPAGRALAQNEPKPLAAPQEAAEVKAKEQPPSLTMLKVRALRDDDKEAIDEIKEGAKDKLDYAWALYDLHSLGLAEAQSEIQSGSFNEYFTRVSKGDLQAFAFLREISSENPEVQRRMRTMDIGGIERRARGEEKVEGIGKDVYIDVLFEMADLKFPTAMLALRNLPPEDLDAPEFEKLISYGNMMAIERIGAKVEGQAESIRTGYDDALEKILTGEMNNENIDTLGLFLLPDNGFIHAEFYLRSKNMDSLVEAALKGNEKAMDLCFEMIEKLGHEGLAGGLIRGNISDLEEQIKKGNLTAYKIFMKLFKFGNIFAPGDLVNLEISGMRTLAEQGNKEAIDDLMELDAYGNSQAGMALGTLDLTEFIKSFNLRSLTMDDVLKLAKLNFTYQNPGAKGAYATLDFTRIPMNLSEKSSRDFNLKAAESRSTGTEVGLRAMDLIAADVFGPQNELSKKIVDPDQLNWIEGLYRFAKNLDISSTQELIKKLDPQALGKEVQAGVKYAAELFDYRRMLWKEKEPPDFEQNVRAADLKKDVSRAMIGNVIRKSFVYASLGVGLMFALPNNVNAQSEKTIQLYRADQNDNGRNMTETDARQELKTNLDAMFNALKTHYGNIVPDQVKSPRLREIAKTAKTYDEFTTAVNNALESLWKRKNSGKMTLNEIKQFADLQEGILRWTFVFWSTNVSYDTFGFETKAYNAADLSYPIRGNPHLQDKNRTYVCDSASEWEILTLLDLGFARAEDNFSIVGVKINFLGQDMDTLGGHVAVLVKTVDGVPRIFDLTQGDVYPDGERSVNGINVPHKVLRIADIKGVERIINVNDGVTGITGETFPNLMTWKLVETEIKDIFSRYNFAGTVFNAGNVSQADQILRDLQIRIKNLEDSPQARRVFVLHRGILDNLQRIKGRIERDLQTDTGSPTKKIDHAMNGGIDLNSANLAMVIKRDGKGVVLPLAQQDLAQLSSVIGDGLEPKILSIRPASQSPVFAQLRH